MNARILSLSLFLSLAYSSVASAEDLIERVVVRNRLYDMSGKVEVGVNLGMQLVTQLTDHKIIGLGVAYNVADTLGFELRGGYAFSGHTGLAGQVAEHLLQRDPASEISVTDDLKNLWEIDAFGLIGARWAPLYGKLNLVADVPVHTQVYLWLGGGAGKLHRESVVVCHGLAGARAEGQCAEWETEDRVSWLASGALGMRFFTHKGGALKLELRDYAFPDEHLKDVDRAAAEKNLASGTKVAAGLTQIVLLELGYALIF